MKKIRYYQHAALVDDEDFLAAIQYSWHVLKISGTSGFQMVTCLGRTQGKRNLYLSRLIANRMGLPPGRIRFASGDSLDCRRANLIHCQTEQAERLARARELLEQGLTIGAIAEALGVCYGTVQRDLRQYKHRDPRPVSIRPDRQTPSGVHRHPLGGKRPADAYMLCDTPLRWRGKLRRCWDPQSAGTAHRVPGGWRARRGDFGDWSPTFRRFSDATAWAWDESLEQAA